MTYRRYDAIIVGARVSGAATALALALAGARVLIVDRSSTIGDTLSTHALMRPAVELLDRWGLLAGLVRAGTPWVRRAQFHYGAEHVEIAIKPSRTAEGLIAPRRWLLDRLILDAAVAAGAELSLGTAFETCVGAAGGRPHAVLLRMPDGTCREVETDVLIGADGRMSQVAAAVGARTLATSGHRTSTVYAYVPGIPNQGYRWYFGKGVTAGVIPTTGGDSCAFAASRPEEYRSRFAENATAGIASVFKDFDPCVAERVRNSAIKRHWRFPGGPGYMRERAGTGWALVGDAAFFRDPVTAHGITDALLDAHVLATTLIDGRLGDYRAIREAQATPLFHITQRMARLDWCLETVKALHIELNACMKSEQDALVAERSFERVDKLDQQQVAVRSPLMDRARQAASLPAPSYTSLDSGSFVR